MERNKVDVAGEDAGSVGSGSMAEPLPMFHRLPDGFVITIPPEDDYDLMNEFERRRYLRIQEVKQRQTHRDRQEKQSRRERLRKELLDDGQKVLKHVQHEFIGIRNILNPFDLKHRMIHEFAELCSRVPAAVKATPMMRLWPTAVRVLRTLKPLPTYSQSRALRARALLNEQLRRHRRNLDWTVMDDDESLTYDAARRIVEVKALRVMELSLRKFVPIPMLRAELWRVKREQMHRCRAKLDAIAHRQQRLLLIPTCRHPYHMRASGCPNCGVIHMGTTGEDNRYVRSRNVDTGVETLIKLEYEEALLVQAHERQLGVVAGTRADLDAFEGALTAQVVVAVQEWYCCYRGRRQCAANELRRAKSLYYFRIRRLSNLKRELDSVDPFTVDKRPLLYRYSEIEAELHEYFNFMFLRKTTMIDRMARLFVRKLRIKVVKRRAKQAAKDDVLHAQAAEKAARALVAAKARELRETRRRVQEMESRRWICMRNGCNLRRFYSADRYNVHMSFHRADDELQRMRDREMARIKAMRDGQASAVLSRIAASRKAIAEVREGGCLAIEDLVGDDPADGSSSSSNSAVPQHVLSSEGLLVASPYHLELVSQREVFAAPRRVALNRPVVRIGMQAKTCEAVVEYSATADTRLLLAPGAAAAAGASLATYDFDTTRRTAVHGRAAINEGGMNAPLVAPVHCVVYFNHAATATAAAPTDGPPASSDERDHDLIVVDNQTRFGTYIVSSRGVRKVPTKLSQAAPLVPGDLLCLGVAFNGHKTLTADEASSACIVYRLCTNA